MKNLMTMGFMIDKVTVNEGAAKSLISSFESFSERNSTSSQPFSVRESMV